MNPFTRKSTPSSEGTGLFCRVPWPEFSRAPWIIHPTHLSWFAVRFAETTLRSFSWQLRLSGLRTRVSALKPGICLGFRPTCLHRDFQHPDRLSSCVPPSHISTSARILTRFPSATPFSLALGADSLREDYLYPENLGFTANGFFTRFIVTHVSIITSPQSIVPCGFDFSP